MHYLTNRLGVACIILVAVAWTLVPRPAAAEDVAAMVQNAKTAADHEAIATYYEKEAAAAKEKAALHRSMGDIVKKQGGPGVAKWGMDKHCLDLVNQYEGAAKSYTDLAKAERELAKTMK